MFGLFPIIRVDGTALSCLFYADTFDETVLGLDASTYISLNSSGVVQVRLSSKGVGLSSGPRCTLSAHHPLGGDPVAGQSELRSEEGRICHQPASENAVQLMG